MNPPLHEFEKLFYRVRNEIKEEDQQCISLLKLFNDLVSSLSEASSLHFNTLFARVSFISTRYQLSKPWSYAMQLVRRELRQRQMTDRELIPIVSTAIQYLLSIYGNELRISRSRWLIVSTEPPK